VAQFEDVMAKFEDEVDQFEEVMDHFWDDLFCDGLNKFGDVPYWLS
jgi:hypothetical protein